MVMVVVGWWLLRWLGLTGWWRLMGGLPHDGSPFFNYVIALFVMKPKHKPP